MEQNIVIAVDHSVEAEQAVKCELRGACINGALGEGRGKITNRIDADGLQCRFEIAYSISVKEIFQRVTNAWSLKFVRKREN